MHFFFHPQTIISPQIFKHIPFNNVIDVLLSGLRNFSFLKLHIFSFRKDAKFLPFLRAFNGDFLLDLVECLSYCFFINKHSHVEIFRELLAIFVIGVPFVANSNDLILFQNLSFFAIICSLVVYLLGYFFRQVLGLASVENDDFWQIAIF